MNNRILLFGLAIISAQYSVCSDKMHLLLTAALVERDAEFRKQQYLKTFKLLEKYGFTKDTIYVAESCKKRGGSFLEEYSSHVYYAQKNTNRRNNGSNEAITTLEAIEHFSFADDSMITKLTDRHHPINGSFFETVKANKDADVIIRWDEESKTPQRRGAAYTTLLAMKCSLYKKMLQELPYDEMEEEKQAFNPPWIELELAQGQYLTRSGYKILSVDNLGIEAHVTGSTTVPGASGTVYQ